MKNIHLLATDKPSKKGDIVVWNGLKIWDGIGKPPHHNQNIYITVDEKPKEGDYCFCIIENRVIRNQVHKNVPNSRKKIILTTDQDLIKNGVQAIDDDFLEWFVKNPSCEFVEVVKGKMQLNDDGQEYGFPDMSLYKIIIPKEKPKQETLEEVAERESQLGEYDRSFESTRKNYFIKGAKWQQERMYSKEEVEVIAKDAYAMGRNNILIGVFNKWFEQFKKK